MNETEFDRFADEYHALHAANVAWSGEQPDFFIDYKVRDAARLVGRASVARILDFGAGIGNAVPAFRTHFPGSALTCADVSRRSLAIGAARFPGTARFVAFDGHELPFDDGHFDLVFAACVFHHIPHEAHDLHLRELTRVLADGGWLVLFEHNPFNPLTVRAVNTCPFDVNARLVRAAALADRCRAAGLEKPLTRYRLFFPRALRLLRSLEPFLYRLPLGAQYYVAARKV